MNLSLSLFSLIPAMIGTAALHFYFKYLIKRIESHLPFDIVNILNSKIRLPSDLQRLQRCKIYHAWLIGNEKVRKDNRILFDYIDKLNLELPGTIRTVSKVILPLFWSMTIPSLGFILFACLEMLGLFDFGLGTYDLEDWQPTGGVAGHTLHFLATLARPLIRHPLFWIIITVLAGRWIYLRKKKKITR